MSRAAGKGLIVVAALLGLAACESGQHAAPEASRLVTATGALALPPPGGPSVLGVVERRYSNAHAQEVALATTGRTPGQNQIAIAVLGSGRPKGDDVMLTPAFSEEAIAQEMRAALPGVGMSISPFFASNAYGAFGYAFGHGAGSDLCLYGWQRIGSAPRPFARQRVISARMRICEPGATEASLLANMQGYTINVPLGPSFRASRPSGTAAGGGLRHVETVLAAPAPAAPARPRARRAPSSAVARAEPPAAPGFALPPSTPRVAPPPAPSFAPSLAPPLAGPVAPGIAPPPAPSLAAPIVPPPPLEAAPPPAPTPAPVPVPPPPVAPMAPMVEAPPLVPPLAPPAPAGVASAAILSEIAE